MSPQPSYCPRQSDRDLDSSSWRNDSSQRSSGSISEETQILSENESVTKESKSGPRPNNLNLVKSMLGPTFEDAVLRTLEFGKSLMQKSDGGNASEKEKSQPEPPTPPSQKRRHDLVLKKKKLSNGESKRLNCRKETRGNQEKRVNKKRLMYSMKTENDPTPNNQQLEIMKPTYLAKIRSLDSELKGLSPSPEEIKKELEALCQVNKDEPPECPRNWAAIGAKDLQRWKDFQNPVNFPLLPTDVYVSEKKTGRANTITGFGRCETVLPCHCTTTRRPETSRCPPPIAEPSRCPPREDLRTNSPRRESSRSSRITNRNHGSTLSTISENRRRESVSRSGRSGRERSISTNPLCQAPEVISNALGPTLDVSIIDNLKMMRDLFKSGEESSGNIPPAESIEEQGQGPGERRRRNSVLSFNSNQNIKNSNKKVDVQKLEELKSTLDELMERKQELTRQIEEEEMERLAKRKAFEEEQKKWESMKGKFEGEKEEKKVTVRKSSTNQCSDIKDCEKKLDCLKKAVDVEEEKLNYLREQHEALMKEICAAQDLKNESLRKNKSLLDAWDVFASRACHTRLPSFSRAHFLERKTLKTCPSTCKSKCSITSSCKVLRSKSCESKKNCAQKSLNDIVKTDFPLQRDITCGIHALIKTCNCKSPIPAELLLWTTDDDLARVSCPSFKSRKEKLKRTSAKIKSKLKLLRSRSCSRSRSKSETGVGTAAKAEKPTRVCKVLWAVARINIFEDNTRTYEILDATSKAPECPPCKTEGIFVVKNTNKKRSSSLSRKNDGT